MDPRHCGLIGARTRADAAKGEHPLIMNTIVVHGDPDSPTRVELARQYPNATIIDAKVSRAPRVVVVAPDPSILDGLAIQDLDESQHASATRKRKKAASDPPAPAKTDRKRTRKRKGGGSDRASSSSKPKPGDASPWWKPELEGLYSQVPSSNHDAVQQTASLVRRQGKEEAKSWLSVKSIPLAYMSTQSLPVPVMEVGIRKTYKLSIAQINRRVARVRERAQKAAAIAANTAFSENNQLMNVGVKKPTVVSARMSSKGFAAKDPQLALKIMRLMHVDAMNSYTFDMLGLTSYKYHVSSLTQTLVNASVYPALRSASMPATQAMRYLYEVAMEVGDNSTRELLCWNTAQQLLQGRESRGVGIVAANDDAKVLVATALAVCVKRVEKCVEAAAEYRRDMSTTANSCH